MNQIVKFKYCVNLQKGKLPQSLVSKPSDTLPIYLSMDYLRGGDEQIKYVEDFQKCVLAEDGDILILWDGSNAGEILLAKRGVVSSTVALVNVNKGLDKKFFYYQLKAKEPEIKDTSVGMGIPHVNPQELLNFSFFIPSLSTQTAIAAYLDRKTAEIDALIADKRRLLELYEEEKTALINQAVTGKLKIGNEEWEMKDSGIDWLGEIPSHWEVKRLKHVVKINSGEGIKSEEIKPDGTYPVYGGNGIAGYTENYNSENTEIIIGRVGAKCGNVRLVAGTKWISDNALVAKLIAEVDINFLSIQMQNMDLNKMANQNAQPLITGTMVKEKEALFPPLPEQQAIVQHIETESARIAAKQAKTERLIALLAEYRTALIGEVVTGKVKITE